MHFGDRPAAAGLEVAKKKVAVLGKRIDEQTAEIITRGYMDDGLGGGPEHVVRKLMGVESFHPPEEETELHIPCPVVGYRDKTRPSPIVGNRVTTRPFPIVGDRKK